MTPPLYPLTLGAQMMTLGEEGINSLPIDDVRAKLPEAWQILMNDYHRIRFAAKPTFKMLVELTAGLNLFAMMLRRVHPELFTPEAERLFQRAVLQRTEGA